jgi:hypothetical protein
MERIEAIAFCMWCSKYAYIKGPEGQWLNYWEHYEVFLTHEARDIYINHAKNMEPKGKK